MGKRVEIDNISVGPYMRSAYIFDYYDHPVEYYKMLTITRKYRDVTRQRVMIWMNKKVDREI